MLRDSRRALLWTALAIFGIVYLTFRNLRITLLVLMPIVFAIVVTFGLLRLIGHAFSFMSVTAIPLIIGIGIDNGIHLVRRYLETLAQQHSCGGQGLRRGADSIQSDHHHRLWRIAGRHVSAAGRIGLVTSLGVALTLAGGLWIIPAVLLLPERAKRAAQGAGPA